MGKKSLMWLLLLGLITSANAQRKLSIDDLFSLVEENNSQLKSGRISVESASHGVASAKSNRLPSVNAQLTGSFNGDVVMMDRDFSNATSFSQPRWGNSFVVEAQQTIYAGGAVNAGIKLAELGKEMEETNLSGTRNNVRFSALAQYLELIKLDNAVRVYDENIQLMNHLIEQVNAKRDEGMALRNDITRYELQLQELTLGKRKVEDARVVVNHQLCNALGLDDETIVPDISITDLKYSQEGEAHWQSLSSTESTDLKKVELGTQMAEQKLKIAKSDLLPKIALVAADNFSGPFTYDIPPVDKNFNIWYVGIGVQYSLGNIWKSNKKISQAKSDLELSESQKSVVAEMLNNRIQEAYTLYMQSYVELETQHKSVELATQNYDVINERYLNSLALITDMLDASNIKLSAELREVDALVNIVFAYHKLKFIANNL
ncbi:MAG: TolC family protein [Paludibacteraceae bacterium]|nr:TolC family protein [Paludibacteraceae bacterium]